MTPTQKVFAWVFLALMGAGSLTFCSAEWLIWWKVTPERSARARHLRRAAVVIYAVGVGVLILFFSTKAP